MIVGIDLGTTNSAISVWRDGNAELIPNSLGHVLTPSAVSVDENGTVLVGLPARERQSTHPSLTATTFKRYMGTQRRTWLGGQHFLPEELSALVLARLKADAEAYLGEPVNEAVIAVPAYFNDKQRKATRRAGQIAGLKVERLLNEPTAAALAYGIHELREQQRFLVFDLGGGTFDVSILEIFEGVIEVRATAGDNQLGGEDFNDVLIGAMHAAFDETWGPKTAKDATLHERLRVSAERARRALSESSHVDMSVTWNDQTYSTSLGAEEFERLSAPLLARLREPLLRSLRDSGLKSDDLKEVILVGGATRMPLVRRAVTRMFGRFPSVKVNPDEAVALGAGIQAGLKARDAALREVVLTDVCPYSLGVDVGERGPNGILKLGIFSPILERNTVIPASRVRTFQPLESGQRLVRFSIYQGESRDVSDNVRLGEIEVPVPPDREGAVSVDVRFSYDINGLLEVDVHVPASGLSRDLVIMEDGAMSPQELERSRAALKALKLHPREDDANKAALSRANRCFQTQLGDKRGHVGMMISHFEAILGNQDPREIAQAREELSKALDAIEGEIYL